MWNVKRGKVRRLLKERTIEDECRRYQWSRCQWVVGREARGPEDEGPEEQKRREWKGGGRAAARASQSLISSVECRGGQLQLWTCSRGKTSRRSCLYMHY
ncbi:hypothetical protein J6590_054734 [Homalodisca vitripennis]|nr:hypothetical protein J6590_054734 [Homalodisca vitripennis]